jgi:hypothetical protein
MKDPSTGEHVPPNVNDVKQLLEDVKEILKGEVAEHTRALPIYVVQAIWRRINLRVCEDPFWALLGQLVEASEWWPALCPPLAAKSDEAVSSDGGVCRIEHEV